MNTMIYTHCKPALLLDTVGGDREVFLELAEIFVRESTECLAHLTSAAQAGNIVQMGYQSHSLKGTVGPLGANTLTAMLFAIEEECSRKECVCDKQRLARILTELQQVNREMQHYIAHL
ncbi:MAG: Hpt domain-containing protein [Herminiimonas sp.]|nr:Hpt domain-containing protein [Herminiimonas sp.]